MTNPLHQILKLIINTHAKTMTIYIHIYIGIMSEIWQNCYMIIHNTHCWPVIIQSFFKRVHHLRCVQVAPHMISGNWDLTHLQKLRSESFSVWSFQKYDMTNRDPLRQRKQKLWAGFSGDMWNTRLQQDSKQLQLQCGFCSVSTLPTQKMCREWLQRLCPTPD